MLIKWTDLEPGDVVRWTDEAIQKFYRNTNNWVLFHNELLTIKEIDYDYYYNRPFNMLITFDKKLLDSDDGFYSVFLKKDNGTFRNVVLFEVIKLKED